MCRFSKNIWICLVSIIINIWFNIKLICKFKCSINMTDTTLIISIYINSHLLFIQFCHNISQIRKCINILSLIFRNFKNIYLFTNSCFFCYHRCFRYNKCSCLHIAWWQILTIQPFFIIRYFFTFFYSP